MHKLILIPLLGAVLTGCAVGPNYQRPATAVTASYGRTQTNHFASAEPEARWWALFGDPTLDHLIQRAVKGNHDIKIAAARLNAARALRRESLWAFAPQGGVFGTFQRRQLAEPESPGLSRSARLGNVWSTGFDATWEIDLFGRLRRSAEAAGAEVGVADAQMRDVQVALLAEVAANYFGLEGASESVNLLRRQTELLQRSLETTRRRVAAGRGSQLDVARAEALLKETESALPLAEREAGEHLHRLAVLLGEQPGSYELATAPERSVPSVHALAIGTPVDLLRRRPDIAAAERQLAAATARVGIRTAEMFPEVSVSGFIRLIGADGVNLGSAASQAWGVAPAASWHVLNLGRLNALRQSSQFEAEGVLAFYEQTVLRALEDAENALVRYRTADQRLRLLAERQAAAERGRRIAQAQYEAGAINSLEATDAERTVLAAERETVAAATEHRLAVVTLYKALGGGWEDEQLFTNK
jgi:outer membrane protein, multidrug efflux system